MTMTFDSRHDPIHDDAPAALKPATSSNKFPVAVAERLLDKLSTDDAFRARFLADVRAALREIGYETAPELVGVEGSDPIMCCLNMKTLAPKAELAASRARLVSRLSTSIFSYDIVV